MHAQTVAVLFGVVIFLAFLAEALTRPWNER